MWNRLLIKPETTFDRADIELSVEKIPTAWPSSSVSPSSGVEEDGESDSIKKDGDRVTASDLGLSKPGSMSNFTDSACLALRAVFVLV